MISGRFRFRKEFPVLSFELNAKQQHAEAGYFLLRQFGPFAEVAEIVRYHHVPWSFGHGRTHNGRVVDLCSHIVNLADRVEISINREVPVKKQLQALRDKISAHRNTLFCPDVVDAFSALSERDYFCYDLDSPSLEKTLSSRCQSPPVEFNLDTLTDLATLFGYTIDFRSRFTALHSSATAVIASSLAESLDFSESETRLMKAAGLLHDVGKLGVPREILEKPCALEKDEFEIIKAHPFHCHRMFHDFTELNEFNKWISFHHERLDGKGYPFGLKGDAIPLGSRVLAVADVYVALTENRPYRQGLTPENALAVVKENMVGGALDDNVVSCLDDNFLYLDGLRRRVQKKGVK